MLALCAAALNGIIDYGDRNQVCVLCSASSRVHELYVLGVGGKWGRAIELGTVATFIERQDQRPCTHRWITCSRVSGNAIYRSVESGSVQLEMLYSMMKTTKLDLDRLQQQDPTFIEKLKKAIRYPENPENQAVVNLLTSDFREFIKEVVKKP